MAQRDETEKARRLIDDARRIFVLTGAGVSAESGVPTFRGKEGLWRNHNPTDLATPEAFARDPKLVWDWYDWRRQRVAPCRPNPAHEAIAILEHRHEDGFLLATQNVDGLHDLAGSMRVARMHGSIWRVKRADGVGGDWEDRTVPLESTPLYDARGNLLRPAVVWYGEIIPDSEMNKVLSFFGGGVDAALVIGTSGMISYIQYWLMGMKRAGVPIVEVNPEPSAISELSDLIVVGNAGEILPRLVE